VTYQTIDPLTPLHVTVRVRPGKPKYADVRPLKFAGIPYCVYQAPSTLSLNVQEVLDVKLLRVMFIQAQYVEVHVGCEVAVPLLTDMEGCGGAGVVTWSGPRLTVGRPLPLLSVRARLKLLL
jgi:hypothetical protein